MLGWLYGILIGSFHVCNHKYSNIGMTNSFGHKVDESGPRIPTAIIITDRCDHCGKIKITKIKG